MKTLLTKRILLVALVSLLILSFVSYQTVFGKSDPSSRTTFTTDTDVYIDHTATATVEPSVRIYPNPVREQFTLYIDNLPQGVYTLEIYNALGDLVQQVFTGQQFNTQFYNTSINIGNLPNGMYFARLYNGTSVMKTVRIVKQQQ